MAVAADRDTDLAFWTVETNKVQLAMKTDDDDVDAISPDTSTTINTEETDDRSCNYTALGVDPVLGTPQIHDIDPLTGVVTSKRSVVFTDESRRYFIGNPRSGPALAEGMLYTPLQYTDASQPAGHPPFRGPGLVAIVVRTGDAFVVADLSKLFGFTSELVELFTGFDPVTNRVLIAGQHWDDCNNGLDSPSTLVAALVEPTGHVVKTVNITRINPHGTEGAAELINMGAFDTQSGILWFTINVRVPGQKRLQQRLQGYDIRNETLAFDTPTPLNTYALAYDESSDTLFTIATCCAPGWPCDEPYKTVCKGSLNITIGQYEYKAGSPLAPTLKLAGVVQNSDPTVSAALYIPTGVLAAGGMIHMQALMMFGSRKNQSHLVLNPIPSKLVSYSTTTGQQLAVVSSGKQDLIVQPIKESCVGGRESQALTSGRLLAVSGSSFAGNVTLSTLDATTGALSPFAALSTVDRYAFDASSAAADQSTGSYFVSLPSDSGAHSYKVDVGAGNIVANASSMGFKSLAFHAKTKKLFGISSDWHGPDASGSKAPVRECVFEVDTTTMQTAAAPLVCLPEWWVLLNTHSAAIDQDSGVYYVACANLNFANTSADYTLFFGVDLLSGKLVSETKREPSAAPTFSSLFYDSNTRRMLSLCSSTKEWSGYVLCEIDPASATVKSHIGIGVFPLLPAGFKSAEPTVHGCGAAARLHYIVFTMLRINSTATSRWLVSVNLDSGAVTSTVKNTPMAANLQFITPPDIVASMKFDDDEASYRIVWNSPFPIECYSQCHDNPRSPNLTQYSIDANSNGNGSMTSNTGPVMTIWDEYFGHFPRMVAPGPRGGRCHMDSLSTCVSENGGLPQLAVLNLRAHVAKIRNDVNTGLYHQLPNNHQQLRAKPLAVDFAGLGVLDWEEWPYSWSRWPLSGFTPQNNVYMNLSVELVLKDHPSWPPKHAEQEAERRYDAAVQTFITATLDTLHVLRPKGRFGMFGWPDCDFQLSANNAPLGCPAGFREMNDNALGWLWNASSALYPDMYIQAPPGQYPKGFEGRLVNVSFDSNQRFVDDVVAEAMHVASSIQDPSQRPAVYPYGRAFWYSWLGYENTSSLMQPRDLQATVGRPAQHGADGVVLWGGSADCGKLSCGADGTCMLCQSKCTAQADYISTSMGPVAAKAVNDADTCAAAHCAGGQRCVTIDDIGRQLQTPRCITGAMKTDTLQTLMWSLTDEIPYSQ